MASIAHNFAQSVPYLENLSEPLDLFLLSPAMHDIDLRESSMFEYFPSSHAPAVLTSNTLPSLSSLLPLAQSKNLVSLSLVGNPVQKEKYYREWVIWKVSAISPKFLQGLMSC